jgi:hypothetical protein
MNGALKGIIGLILIVVGVYIYVSGWFNGFFAKEFINLLKLIVGNIPGLIALICLLFAFLVFSVLRD